MYSYRVIQKNRIETPNCVFWLKKLPKAQGGLNFLGKGFFVNTIKGTTDPKVECSYESFLVIPQVDQNSFQNIHKTSAPNFGLYIL